MKKILKFIRGLSIFVIWTPLFVSLSNILIYQIWKFNFLSSASWNILSSFWNHGGVIKTASDLLLLLSLFLLPFLWFTGFIISLKINYFKALAGLFSRFCISQKPQQPERIIIKNLKNSKQLVEDIKNEIESIKPQKSEEASNIRSEITKKLSQEIKN